jgi:hypothetical protein
MKPMKPACRYALPLLLLVALGCRKPDYFPLKDGQEWRFAGISELNLSDEPDHESLTYAIKVTGSAVQPGLGRVYEVRVTRNEEPYMMLFVRKTKDAVFVMPASHLDGFEPTPGWVKFLELPLRENALWYGDAERSVSFDAKVREDIEIPAGQFRNCFQVRVLAPAPYRVTFWLAPDAGIVRWTRTFSVVRFELSERIRR